MFIFTFALLINIYEFVKKQTVIAEEWRGWFSLRLWFHYEGKTIVSLLDSNGMWLSFVRSFVRLFVYSKLFHRKRCYRRCYSLVDSIESGFRSVPFSTKAMATTELS